MHQTNPRLRFASLLPAPLLFIGCSTDPSLVPVDRGSIRLEQSTPQFRAAVDHHLHNPLSPLVYISWFPDPGSEELAEIGATGAGVKGWVRAGGPILAAGASAAGLDEIRQRLSELPPSAQRVPQSQSVIVTFQTPSGLETRVYDRYALPPSVHRIWHIIAFPGMAMTTQPTTQSQIPGMK